MCVVCARARESVCVRVCVVRARVVRACVCLLRARACVCVCVDHALLCCKVGNTLSQTC